MTYNAMQLLTKFSIRQEKFILPAMYVDPSCRLYGWVRGAGESEIAHHEGMIDYVYVTNTYNDETPKASRKVVDAILESDMGDFRTGFSFLHQSFLI